MPDVSVTISPDLQMELMEFVGYQRAKEIVREYEEKEKENEYNS